MSNKADLRYAESHEWVRFEGNIATIGISEFAVKSLTDLVYVELPEIGRKVSVGETFGVVESVKAVSDLYAPISGTVREVNEQLPSNLDWLSQSPYGQGWIIKLRLTNTDDLNNLMSQNDYEVFCEHEAH